MTKLVIANLTKFEVDCEERDVYLCEDCSTEDDEVYHVSLGGHPVESGTGRVWCEDRGGFDCCRHLVAFDATCNALLDTACPRVGFSRDEVVDAAEQLRILDSAPTIVASHIAEAIHYLAGGSGPDDRREAAKRGWWS